MRQPLEYSFSVRNFSEPFHSLPRNIPKTGRRAPMFQDVRYALRMLHKSKALTITAILSLAFGIGANTSLFSMAEALLFRAIPIENAHELVLFNWAQGPYRLAINTSGSSTTDRSTGENVANMFSHLAYQRMREHNRQSQLLSEVFGFVQLGRWNVSVEDRSHAAIGQLVTGNYFSALRVPAMIGRVIQEADDQASADPVAVLSHRYWEQQLGMDPDIVGKTIYLNKVPLTIAGVTPREFRGVEQMSNARDISIPLAMEPRIRTGRSRINEPWSWWLMIMGRLQPGVTPERAQANLNPVFQQAALEGWNAATPELRSSRLDADQPRSPIRLIVSSAVTGFDNMNNNLRPVMMLSIVTGLILLIVCANLANLLLAKSSARHREIAVRLSMGASRGRLLQQLLTESIILSICGAVAGLLVAGWTNNVLEGWVGGDDRALVSFELNLGVLAATLAVSLFTGILFGLAPALRSTRVDLNETIKETSRSVSGGRSRLSKGLLVTQVALSLVLLYGAGLFLKTLHNLQTADAGFTRENLLWFSVNPLLNRYSEAQIVNVYDRMIEAIEAVPGVRAATMSQIRLLSGGQWSGNVFIEGSSIDAASRIAVHFLHIRPNFLDTMGMRLLLGRNLSAADTKASPKVALINETMARRSSKASTRSAKDFAVVRKLRHTSKSSASSAIRSTRASNEKSHQRSTRTTCRRASAEWISQCVRASSRCR
jgi:predicted permease